MKTLLYNALIFLSDTTFDKFINGQEWPEMVYRELGTTKEELAGYGISINEYGEVFYL